MPKSYSFAAKSFVATSIFIALIVWVELQLGWASVLSIWASVSVTFTIFISICVLLSHFLRVIRVYYAYGKKFKLKLRDVAGVSLMHNTISFLLPMRLGEAALPMLSKNQLNVDYRYSTSALVLLRVFDAHCLMILILCFGSSAYLAGQTKFILWLLALTSPLALMLIALWLRQSTKLQSVKPLVSSMRTLIMLYLMTGLIWIVKLSALAMLAQQLGKLAFSHAWVATIIADASALSPVTGIANAGTFEAAFTLPLLALGYGSDILLNVALNLHILILLTNVAAGGIGFALLVTKPIKQV